LKLGSSEGGSWTTYFFRLLRNRANKASDTIPVVTRTEVMPLSGTETTLARKLLTEDNMGGGFRDVRVLTLNS